MTFLKASCDRAGWIRGIRGCLGMLRGCLGDIREHCGIFRGFLGLKQLATRIQNPDFQLCLHSLFPP